LTCEDDVVKNVNGAVEELRAARRTRKKKQIHWHRDHASFVENEHDQLGNASVVVHSVHEQQRVKEAELCRNEKEQEKHQPSK
jgi:hypothetical protein